MLTPDELALTPYRDAFAQMALGAVVIPRAIDEPAHREVRERLTLASFVPFRLVHKGHFSYLDELDAPVLVDALVRIAELVSETRLAVLLTRVYRLTRGDYVLSAIDVDQLGTRAERRLIDVVADLSEASSGEAQVVYAHRGEHYFAAPQLSRSVSVIERRASVTRYQRYLNHTTEGRVVFRLCLTLQRVDVTPTDPTSLR